MQIFRLAAQADPTERAIAVIKELRSHDIFDIARPNEAVLIINAVLGDFRYTGIKDSFHERVAIVKEIDSFAGNAFQCIVMGMEGLINEFTEMLGIFGKHLRTFFKSQALRAVSAVIYVVAAGLVGHKVNMDIMVSDIFKKVDNVPMISVGFAFLFSHCILSQFDDLRNGIRDSRNPALIKTGLDAGCHRLQQ